MNEPASRETHQIPLHRRIAEALTQQVTSGELRPGQRLPSERQIAEIYGASRATVRTALNHLEQSGIISRRERRSAIVAIRRDVVPSIRIVCGSERVLQLFRKLGELQVLPARYQLHYVDLLQGGSLDYILSQPSDSGDLLVCELDALPCILKRENYASPLPQSHFADAHLCGRLDRYILDKRHYRAVLLSQSPMVLYANRRAGSASGDDSFHIPETREELIHHVNHHVSSGVFGLQLRPSLSHLAYWFSLFENDLFSRSNGRLEEVSGIWTTLHQWLHTTRRVPILARTDHIDAFAKGRCSMAIDSAQVLHAYDKSIGSDLVITTPPGPGAGPQSGILSGIVAVALPSESEPVQSIDLLRNLLSTPVQRMLVSQGAGLPAREDLLTTEELASMDIPPAVIPALLEELHRAELPAYPDEAKVKAEMESIVLEFWLGLENVDSICSRYLELID